MTGHRPDQPIRLILASASPRRHRLLRDAGYRFEVIVPPDDEPPLESNHAEPARLAEAISRAKARAVAPLVDDAVVIAADTIVAQEGRLFGKPRDREHAREILTALTAAPHDVITGVTLIDLPGRREQIAHDVTRVYMRPMVGEEMERYLDSGAWAGKAGAYGIQDRGDAFVIRIEGSFTNVVGLPMGRLTAMLSAWSLQRPAP